MGNLLAGNFENPDLFKHPGRFEAWSAPWYSSCSTTLLYYVFNQTIPGWVTAALIFNNIKSKFNPVILALALISAPFPCLGLLLPLIYVYIKNALAQTTLTGKLKYLFSPEYIISAVVVVPVAYYYLIHSSYDNEMSGIVNELGLVTVALCALWVVVINVGIYLPFIWSYVKRNAVYWLMIATYLILSVFGGSDMGSR